MVLTNHFTLLSRQSYDKCCQDILTYVTRTNVTETNANIQNTLDHLDLIDLGYMQKFSFLGHQEVVKNEGLLVGGGWVWMVGLMQIMSRCGSILQDSQIS